MMERTKAVKFLLSLLAGAAYVLAFAPFNFFPLAAISLIVLFWLWLAAQSKAQAFWLGWFFGLGQFGGGVSWMYISLTTFGGMPVFLAVLAMLLLVMGLALFPAMVGLAQHLFYRASMPIRTLLVIPPIWGLI